MIFFKKVSNIIEDVPKCGSAVLSTKIVCLYKAKIEINLSDKLVQQRLATDNLKQIKQNLLYIPVTCSATTKKASLIRIE
jgi:hypothetical protein